MQKKRFTSFDGYSRHVKAEKDKDSTTPVVPIEYRRLLRIQAKEDEDEGDEDDEEVGEILDGDKGMSRNGCLYIVVSCNSHHAPFSFL